MHFPLKQRLALIAVLVIPSLLVWKSNPSLWIPAVPFFILLGGSQVAIGVFFPTIITLAGFCLFLFYAAGTILRNRPLPSLPLSVKLVLLAFLVQVVSITISIHIHGQFFWNAVREGSTIFLFMPFIFIIPDLCNTDNKLQRLGRSIALALLFASILGVAEYFSISGFSRIDMALGYVYKGRVGSFLYSPNVFSGYLELTVPLSIALGMWEKSLTWKIVSFSAAALGVLSVLFTFSRGGLMSVTLGCAIVMVYRFRKRIWIPILMGLLFAGVLVKYADVFERQMSFFANPAELMHQPTLLHRYITYKGFYREFLESPLTGTGWGSKPHYWGRTRLYSFWEVRHTVSTDHMKQFGGLNNLILTHAVRGGLVGLGALFLVLLSAAMVSFSAYKRVPRPWGIGIAAGFIGFFTHQTMDNFLKWNQTSCLFWLLMGIAIAAVKISQTKATLLNDVSGK